MIHLKMMESRLILAIQIYRSKKNNEVILLIWKDVVGYEGIYEVSSCGQVRSHEDKTTHSNLHGVRNWKQRVLKQKISKDNTRRVTLYKDKEPRTWLVHRLVAKAFIPMIEGKNYINHLDGNRLNNHVDNLEWCDHKENNNHAFDNGLMTTNKSLILVNKKTQEPLHFRSLARASTYLGFNSGYLSAKFNRGSYELEGYDIYKKVN